MKMRRMMVTCLAGLMVFLCGCAGSARKDARKIVLDTYEAYEQMWADVFFTWPKTAGDVNDVFTLEGLEGSYVVVDDARYRSMADIMQTIRAICTSNGAAQLETIYFQKEIPLFVERDGVLYRQNADDMGHPFYQDRAKVDVQILTQEESYIHAKVEFACEWDLPGTAYVDLELVLEDGVWKVDSVEREDVTYDPQALQWEAAAEELKEAGETFSLIREPMIQDIQFVIFDVLSEEEAEPQGKYLVCLFDKDDPAKLLHHEFFEADPDEFIELFPISYEGKNYAVWVLQKLETWEGTQVPYEWKEELGAVYAQQIAIVLGDKYGKRIDIDANGFDGRELSVVRIDVLDGDVAYAWLFTNVSSSELNDSFLNNERYWDNVGLPQGMLFPAGWNYYTYADMQRFTFYQGKPAFRHKLDNIEVHQLFTEGKVCINNGVVEKEFVWDIEMPRYCSELINLTYVGSYLDDGKRQIIFRYTIGTGSGALEEELRVLDYDTLEEYTIPDFVELVNQDEEILTAIDAWTEDWGADPEKIVIGAWKYYEIIDNRLIVTLNVSEMTLEEFGKLKIVLKAEDGTLYMDSWELVDVES